MEHLLPRRPVVWVNTIGTRPPRLNWATVTRGIEKLRGWLRASGGRQPPDAVEIGGLTPPARPEPRVVNPVMWPSFRSRLARRLNRRLLTRAVRPVAEAMPRPPVVVTTLPLTAD